MHTRHAAVHTLAEGIPGTPVTAYRDKLNAGHYAAPKPGAKEKPPEKPKPAAKKKPNG